MILFNLYSMIRNKRSGGVPCLYVYTVISCQVSV